jgi:hypothetical protein
MQWPTRVASRSPFCGLVLAQAPFERGDVTGILRALTTQAVSQQTALVFGLLLA